MVDNVIQSFSAHMTGWSYGAVYMPYWTYLQYPLCAMKQSHDACGCKAACAESFRLCCLSAGMRADPICQSNL